jgi:hypothetical protein
VVWNVFKLKEHLAFDVDGVNQCGHELPSGWRGIVWKQETE